MEYLYAAQPLGVGAGSGEAPASPITAAGKHVIVIGGGDTGADCVGNSHREGAASVTQLELLGEPPALAARRPHAVAALAAEAAPLRYAIEEGGEQGFAISTTELTGATAGSSRSHWAQNVGHAAVRARSRAREVEHPADLVLLAMGFLAPEHDRCSSSSASSIDPRGNVQAGAYATSRRRRLRRRRRAPRPVADRVGDQRGPPVRARGRPLPAACRPRTSATSSPRAPRSSTTRATARRRPSRRPGARERASRS